MAQAGEINTRSFVVDAAVQLGLVPGISGVHKFGANAAVGASFEAIWVAGGSYNFLASAETIRVAAGGDVADTAAGTGAQQITVQGLDANGDEQTVTIETNGASASTSTTETFWRVNRAFVSRVGSGDVNAAAVSIETTGGTEIARIGAGASQTEQAVYTIPRGYKGTIPYAQLTTDANSANAILRIRQHATVADTSQAMRTVSRGYGLQGSVNRSFHANNTLPALTDIWVEAQRATGSDAAVTVDFDVILVRV